MKIKFKFLWYDFWVGLYYDRNAKTLYICPIPMCVIKITMQKKETIKAKVVAGVVIKQNNKYLLVQEATKAYGLWNFPAGQVDVGENFEQAAIREAKEESGYDVELMGKIGIFQEKPIDAVKHAFEAKIIGGELNFPKDELLDVAWFTFTEIEEMKTQGKLRSNWVWEAIYILEKHD
jgi:8-oxo-dGTP diphosphatase